MDQMDLFEKNETAAPYAPPDLSGLYELSIEAYYAALHSEMSGLPIKKEISRFVEKVGRAKDRETASRLASDRGDPDVLAVLKTAAKVQHEIHRLTGFLRFKPEADGVYTARCSPDYFILPALAEHFTLRFGETPWAIIDEKRGLCLCRQNGGDAQLIALPASGQSAARTEEETDDFWEDLWRLYHNSINNESRKNLSLQRQFMPKRYRKYLSELN
jgi:probable DNA metabolism protein